MKKLGATFPTSSNDLVIKDLRARERLLIRRDDMHASAEKRRVRLSHGSRRGIVDEYDRVVGAYERRELALEVGHVCRGRGGGRGGGTEKSAPVGRGRDAVCVEDGRFGGGERDEAEGMGRWERLELAHEFGADESDAYDGDGDGFRMFGGGEGHGGATGESNERKVTSRRERSFKSRR